VKSRPRARLVALALVCLAAVPAGYAIAQEVAPEPDPGRPEGVVKEFVVLEESEREARPLEGELVAQGTTPDGTPYEIRTSAEADDGMCVWLSWSVEASDSGEHPAHFLGFCGHPSWRDSVVEGASFQPLDSGGTIAAGLADPDVAAVELAYSDPESGEREQLRSDYYRISGAVRHGDGSTERFEPVGVYVSAFPPGVGDLEQGSTIGALALSEAGEAMGSAELSWVRVQGSGAEANLFTCGSEPFREDICRDAKSGELRRVDRSLAAPLVPELTEALADRGYEFSPASDADRELPRYREPELYEDGLPTVFAGREGLHYLHLGRVSGPGGLDDHLVYLVHFFSIEGEPNASGDGSSSTDASSMPDAPNAIDPTAETHLLDAMTGEELRVLDSR
jgi:hypothetical protein